MSSGHAFAVSDVCFDCRSRLRDADGTYTEYLHDDGKVAFAAPVCHYCRAVRDSEKGAGKVPDDLDKRLAHLRSLPTKANYAVALWSKTVMGEDEITERRYAVNLNGSISTRKDTCDLQRRAKSFQTDGWQPYTPKVPIKDVKDALALVQKSLEPQGYRRLF